MRLLVALVVIALLGIAADAAAEEAAEARIGDRLSSSVEGADEVEVEVRGRPFLLQVIRGRFSGMDVSVPSVERRGVEVEDVRLVFDDVEFSVGELLEGTGDVTVGGGSGSGSVTERGVNAALRREGLDATISLDGDRATVAAGGVETDVDGVAIANGVLEFRAGAIGPVQIALPGFIEALRYRDATVVDSRIVVSIDVPATAIDPGGF